MSFGSYPALSLKEARELHDEARNLLAKGVNPHIERKRKRHAIVLAGEHTFQAVYDQWLKHRKLSLEEGRQTSLEQIAHVFKKDVFPMLRTWPYLWIDATYVKTREAGRIVSVAVIVAVGVNTDGQREVLGLKVGASEAEPFWTEFLLSLNRRYMQLEGLQIINGTVPIRLSAVAR